MSDHRWVRLLCVAAAAVGIGGALLPPASAAATSPATGSSPSSFQYEIKEVTAADLPYTYRAGCPVPPEDLRLLVMSYRTFDGRDAQGEMVVHEDWAGPVVSVFHELYDQGFPIARMQLVDDLLALAARLVRETGALINGAACGQAPLDGDKSAWITHATPLSARHRALGRGPPEPGVGRAASL